MRSTAMTCAGRLEYHADNHSLFIPLEAPWSGADLGARARAETFCQRFGEKAEALRKAGIDVGAFAPAAPEGRLLATFARQLQLACAALQPPLRGLVVVLAPTRVDDAQAFVDDVRLLVGSPALREVRWVVIESDTVHLAPLASELGEVASRVDFRIDESDQQQDLAALAGPTPTEGVAEPLPYPWGPWTSRGAMPRVAPPRRADDRPAPSDEQLLASGIQPAYLKGGGREMQRLMLQAALALRQGRLPDAMELQARTAALCGSLELPREQVIHLLVLGGYQLAASLPERARESYQQAAEVAAAKQLLLQQAQAELGLGMLDASAQNPEAARHYAAAAGLAEQAQTIPLAIECWRMAGQCSSDHQALDWAVECWRHALQLAGSLEPEAVRATSAPDIARALANLLLTRGQSAEAEQLHRQAFRMEHGVEPGPVLAPVAR